MEVIARGVRNTQGFAWHPQTQAMRFTDHGRDGMGDDGPADELSRMTRVGLNFGFPHCHAQGINDSDFPKANACDGVTPDGSLLVSDEQLGAIYRISHAK